VPRHRRRRQPHQHRGRGRGQLPGREGQDEHDAELGIRGAIHDILITLDDQIHLIRPLKKYDNLFIYLAVDKVKGNLGMARHRLQKIETDREPPPPVPGSPLWFVREPLDPASLVALIRERLAAPPLGSAVAIAELAQILVMERRSCTLRVHLKGASGELLFNGGVLVDAAVGGLVGDAAARVLLSWRRAMLRVEPPGRARKPTVLSELAALMPGLTVLSADTVAVALAGDRVTSVTAHVSAALTEHTTPTAAADPPSAAPERRTTLRIVPPQPEPPPVHVPAWERPAAQAPIAALLTDALKIDGAIGAALAIWELDHCLGARSTAPALVMDRLRTTLSGNCRVMRAMMSTLHRLGQSPKISDVLITLDDQIHVLSPVLRHDGLFLDLVLDRARGTLALARLQVRGLLERFSLVDEP
jgi:hypothetical protein